MSQNIPTVVSSKPNTVPGLIAAYQTMSQTLPSIVGSSNSIQVETSLSSKVETSLSVVTSGQLLQSGSSALVSSQPLQTNQKNVEAKPIEFKSKPLLPEPLVHAPVEAMEPIPPLPKPTAKKDAGDCERATRSRTTETSGTVKDSDENLMISESPSQPSFATQLLQKLHSKADAAPNKDLSNVTLNKCKSLSESGSQMHETRQPTKMSSQPARVSSRESPFLCASTIANKDEQRSSNGDIKAFESVSTSLTHLGENHSSPSMRKRRVSETRDSLELKSKKVQEVVLLDEETQPVQPIQIDDSDKWKEAKIYYPSRDDPESVEISYADLKCLEPESYLSSPIMNFYIQYLQRPVSSVGRLRGEYYFFNTYFYKKLEEALSSKSNKNACFLKLRRWWKGVNIFQKAYIFLPIHGDWHWSLVIICIPAKEDESGPIILHLDSLGIHSSYSVFDVIERYLKEEWNYLNQNALPPDVPISARIWKHLPRRIEKKKINVPQQKNEYDCGLFVLYFMERFIEEAPERLRKKDLAMFGSKWFQPEDASGLRKQIRDLLLEVFGSAKMENGRIEPVASSGSSPEV